LVIGIYPGNYGVYIAFPYQFAIYICAVNHQYFAAAVAAQVYYSKVPVSGRRAGDPICYFYRLSISAEQ
jgi:hypothetical protein